MRDTQKELLCPDPDPFTFSAIPPMGGVGKYGCDQCNKLYSNQGNLYTHKQSKHEGMRYCCDQCDYKATRQDSLTIHKLSKHEGVQYECDQCDFKSAWKIKLTRHKQSNHE